MEREDTYSQEGLPHLCEGHVLLQSQPLDKGDLAGCRSPADPDRNMPELTELLNHAKNQGGSYDPGLDGTGRVVLSPVQNTTRKHRGSPRASSVLPTLGHFSMSSLRLEGESNKEKLIPFPIAAGWLLAVPGRFLSLHAPVCLDALLVPPS